MRIVGLACLLFPILFVTTNLVPLFLGATNTTAIPSFSGRALVSMIVTLVGLLVLLPSFGDRFIGWRAPNFLIALLLRGAYFLAVTFALFTAGASTGARMFRVESIDVRDVQVAILLVWVFFIFFALIPGFYRIALRQRTGEISFRSALYSTTLFSAKLSGKSNPLSIVLAVILFSGLFIGFYGLREAQFILNGDLVDRITPWRATLAIAIGMLICFALLLNGRETLSARLPGRPGPRMALVYVLFFSTFFGGLAWANLPRVLPTGYAALHSLIQPGAPGELRVKVLAKGREIRRRACNRTAIVKVPDHSDPITICEVEREIWTNLSPGQTMILRGHRTAFGFRYDDAIIRRLPSN